MAIHAKQKIYLETSVISAYFDFWSQAPDQKRSTRKFWKIMIKQHQPYVSDVAMAELADAHKDLGAKLIKLIKPFERIKDNREAQIIRDKYIEYNIVPASKRADAGHLALAAVYEMDFLVSWNHRHITRPVKRKQITDFNIKHKLPVPVILTPDDFLEDLT